MLQPTCDRFFLESWANRRKDVRLVADVVGDRQVKISRSKVVRHAKNQSHRAYDQVTMKLRTKQFTIVDPSQTDRRKDVRLVAEVVGISRVKSVATRSMVMFKTCNLRFQIVGGRTISLATGRATLRPVIPPIGCSLTLYNVEMFLGFTPHTTPDAIGRRIPRLIVRSIVGATIDRTIDRLWLPLVVRSSPIVVYRATPHTTNRTMTYHQQERPTAVCDRDRSKHCRSVARSPNSNQPHDQEIVRSGVTVALVLKKYYC